MPATCRGMLGMSAAAVHVFLVGERFQGAGARKALADYGWLFALSIPIAHVASLCIPCPLVVSITGITNLVLATIVLGVPFYLAGLLVTIALTRVGSWIGLTYAVDLLGASLGSLVVIPLLYWLNISSAVFALAWFAAAAAFCFQRFAGLNRERRVLWLEVVLLAAAVLNNQTAYGLRVLYVKNGIQPPSDVKYEAWNTHSQVIAGAEVNGQPFYWGANPPAGLTATAVPQRIDGDAFTAVIRWDGDPASLSWVKYDVTSLPYHLRQGGDVAIIGPGGGRDILSALWGRSHSVIWIELNGAILHLLQGPLKDFANLAGRRDVTLVHDEARSYLTHQKNRFDIIQMSLVDTWAATGAGAFTLSENGLYTKEAWRAYFAALRPGGLISVSRWYYAEHPTETARLLPGDIYPARSGNQRPCCSPGPGRYRPDRDPGDL
jgi:hypothetical protein